MWVLEVALVFYLCLSFSAGNGIHGFKSCLGSRELTQDWPQLQGAGAPELQLQSYSSKLRSEGPPECQLQNPRSRGLPSSSSRARVPEPCGAAAPQLEDSRVLQQWRSSIATPEPQANAPMLQCKKFLAPESKLKSSKAGGSKTRSPP